MNGNTTKWTTEIRATLADTPQTGGTLSAAKTSWTRGDRVSVFNGTTGNERWRLVGETGERTGVLSRMNGEPSQTAIDGVVAIYPYEFHNKLSTNGNACINIPAQQTYCATRPAGTMVAYGSKVGLRFRNVGCCIEIGLTGNARICRLEIRCNAGETLAGVAEIDRELKAAFIDNESDKITLDCGDGMDLGSASTRFCFAMLPQTFEYGLTITIFDSEKRLMAYRVNDPITLGNSEIFSIASIEYIGRIPTIQYESANGEIVEPHSNSAFDAKIVSNTYKDGKGIIAFDNDITIIGKEAFRSCKRGGNCAFVGCAKQLKSVIIPHGVTSISDYAFSGCTRLISVAVPDSVTLIGDRAFCGCSGLTSITISDSVTAIGKFAFHGCRDLTSITIPDSVTKIGEGAFYGCTGLTSITIPDSVTKIDEEAFSGCASLTSVTIPDSVTAIGKFAFSGCIGLTSITIPDSVTAIGKFAFSGCASLTSVTIPDSVTAIGSSAFSSCAGLTSITIPDSVTEIGGSAFQGCTSLTSVTIPDSVTAIGGWAFRNCAGLISITIPDSVTKIEYYAFSGCTSLTSVTIPDSVTEIGNGAFSKCTGLTSFYGKFTSEDNRCLVVNGELHSFAPNVLTEYIIPDGVTEIGSSVFYRYTGLASITIPDSVTAIGKSAFEGCTSLTSITISDSVTEIGIGAFYGCTGLTSVTIPDGVTEIGDWAFSRCAGLTSITIPDSVKKIGKSAFKGCTSLISIYCKPTTPPTLSEDVFDNIATDAKIYVPRASANAYKSADGWEKYASRIEGYDF